MRGVGTGDVDDDGWFAEMAVPMKTISFNPDTDTWGFNVGRVIRRKQETVRWAGISRASGVRNVGNAGRIRGIGGLNQGLGLTLKPYLTGTYQIDDNDVEIKPSFDLFYKLTPATTLASRRCSTAADTTRSRWAASAIRRLATSRRRY